MVPIQNSISSQDRCLSAKPDFYHERISFLNFLFFPNTNEIFMLQKADVPLSPGGSYDQNPYT